METTMVLLGQRYRNVYRKQRQWKPMGYLVSAHITSAKADLSALDKLPSSIGWKAYRHRTTETFAIDTYRGSRGPKTPFWTQAYPLHMSYDLPEELCTLKRLHDFLDENEAADFFDIRYINSALLLNQLLSAPVLFFISDDEESDFACIAADDRLTWCKGRAGDLEIVLSNGTTHVQRLRLYDEDDEEFITDLSELSLANPNLSIADSDVEFDTQLHRIAMEGWAVYSNGQPMIFGLDRWDPPGIESEWEFIAASKDT